MMIKKSSEGSGKNKENNPGFACSKRQQASCLKNRSKSLKKKLYELTTLCGIEGFMLILPEPGQGSSLEPVIWPENHGEIVRLIKQFNNEDHGKRRMGLKKYEKEAFSREQRRPAKKQKFCPRAENCIDGFSLEQLQELKTDVDSKILEVNAKIDALEGKQREVLENIGCSDLIVMECSDGFSHCSAMGADPLNWLHQGPETLENKMFDCAPPSSIDNFDMNGFDGFSHCPAMDVGPLNWLPQGSETLEEMVFDCATPTTTCNFEMNGFDGLSHCPAVSVSPLNWLHQGSGTLEEMVFNCASPTTTSNFDMKGFDGFSHCPAVDVDPLDWLYQGPEIIEEMMFNYAPPGSQQQQVTQTQMQNFFQWCA